MTQVAKGEWQGTKAELDAAVAAYRAAREAHKDTVGQPAPLPASEAVDRIVRSGEAYTFEEEATLPPTATLVEAKGEKRKLLAVASQRAIEAGITSTVLGAPHSYPTDLTSQHNLHGLVTAAVVDGTGGKFWCTDTGGVWARHDHTADQIKQLGREVKAHVQAQQDRYEQRLAALTAATTKEEVAAITW